MTALALRLRRSRHLPVVAAAACTLGLLLVGSLYSRNFLSADYLLLQLQIASFLGLVATGAMLVILLGGIDLSVPWLVTVGGVMSAAAAGWWGPAGEWLGDSVRHSLRPACSESSTASAWLTCACRR